jgi:hypothetical protein
MTTTEKLAKIRARCVGGGTAMTPEAQRIVISEVMPHGLLEGQRWPFQGHWIFFDPVNSLDAMHEAEKVLTQSQLSFYYEELKSLCNTQGVHPCSATAAKRAEAFLRTLGLWKEDSL